MRTIKIGIIGCGVISNTYISDIKRLYRELEIAAVVEMIGSLDRKARTIIIPSKTKKVGFK